MVGPEAKKLFDTVARIINVRASETRISPSWIATEAITDLDPERVSVPLVYLGCHLQLRQIARQLLRKSFESEETESFQHNLFPNLQARYPTARSVDADEPEYVVLEMLSDEDIDYNIDRLRSEAMSKLKHADALAAFKRARIRHIPDQADAPFHAADQT